MGTEILLGQPQGPPNQGQPSYVQTPQGQPHYGQSYPGQSGGPQGQPYQGQPSATGGPSFHLSESTFWLSGATYQQGQPGFQQGYPSGQTGHQLLQSTSQPSVQQGYPSGQGDNLIFSKVNRLSNRYPSGQGGQPTTARPTHCTSLVTCLGPRRASLLYSKANPLPSLVIHLDKLANLKVNQLSSPLNHLFRKDNPWLHKDNLVPSKLILLGKQVRPKPNQANLPARWSKLNRSRTFFWAPNSNWFSNARWVTIPTFLPNAAFLSGSVWSPATVWLPATPGANSVYPLSKLSTNAGHSLSELSATVCCSCRSSC